MAHQTRSGTHLAHRRHEGSRTATPMPSAPTGSFGSRRRVARLPPRSSTDPSVVQPEHLTEPCGRFDAQFVAQLFAIAVVVPPGVGNVAFGQVGADECHTGTFAERVSPHGG